MCLFEQSGPKLSMSSSNSKTLSRPLDSRYDDSLIPFVFVGIRFQQLFWSSQFRLITCMVFAILLNTHVRFYPSTACSPVNRAKTNPACFTSKRWCTHSFRRCSLLGLLCFWFSLPPIWSRWGAMRDTGGRLCATSGSRPRLWRYSSCIRRYDCPRKCVSIIANQCIFGMLTWLSCVNFEFVCLWFATQITMQSFLMFSCKRMGLRPDDLYLYADLTQQCWTQKHWAWGLFLGVRWFCCIYIGAIVEFATAGNYVRV